MNLNFSNHHVIVTGGTGALGAAIAELLINAGATVHIPAHAPPDPAQFPLAKYDRIKITAPIDLGDEQAVQSFYQSLPSLWASINAAGGFTAAPITQTSLADFKKM